MCYKLGAMSHITVSSHSIATQNPVATLRIRRNMNNLSLTKQQAAALRDLLGQCGRRELEALFKKRRGDEQVERFQKTLEEVYDMFCVAVGRAGELSLTKRLERPKLSYQRMSPVRRKRLSLARRAMTLYPWGVVHRIEPRFTEKRFHPFHPTTQALFLRRELNPLFRGKESIGRDPSCSRAAPNLSAEAGMATVAVLERCCRCIDVQVRK